MREKRFKKKVLTALGIVTVLAIGVGLLTVFATSSAAADVTVNQQEGIQINAVNSLSLGTGYGFGRVHKDSGAVLWSIDPDPKAEKETTDFRFTVTEHSDLSDPLYKLNLDNPSDSLTYDVYAENGKISHNSEATFYLNPGSGSTTIYVSISNDDDPNMADNFEVTLDSVSWANSPFKQGIGDQTATLVASGKALD